MVDDKKLFNFKNYMYELFLITVATSMVLIVSILKSCSHVEILRNLIMTIMGLGVIGIVFRQHYIYRMLDYDNNEHIKRFITCMVLSFTGCIMCSFMPSQGWPFLVVFLVLSLFGNSLLGIVSGSVFLSITLLLSNENINVFILYFICGVLSILLFRNLEENFKVGIPILITLMALLLSITVNMLIFLNDSLTFDSLVVPFINVIITGILFLFILEVFFKNVVFKYRATYLDLITPDCDVLKEMKTYSSEEYFSSMHTAYFCERIALHLNLDYHALKAAALYYKINKFKSEKEIEEFEKLKYPPKMKKIIKEFYGITNPISEKETVVLICSDAIINAILFLIKNTKEKELNYNNIIETILRKKFNTSELLQSKISLYEITEMKKIFQEEKFNYDFLR